VIAGIAVLAAIMAADAFTLTSSAFQSGQPIPAVHTCQGADVSPPLRWTDPPPGTRSLALIVEDPDAPDPAAPRMVFAHWVLYNLPPSAGSLPQAVTANAMPAGTRQGTNDFRRSGYGGPCPPVGRHRYFFKLFALDTVLPDLGPAGKAAVERAMAGHVIGTAELMGTYQK
jgi:Raf kinase inhibitor-like YbhB/YbcL family protein